MNKRMVLFVILGLTVLLTAGIVLTKQSQQRGGLTVVSFGGAYQAAQRKAYMGPYTAKTGTKIVEGEYNGDYGILRARATAPSATWDIVSVESAPALRGELEGLFEALPDRVFEGLPLVPAARRTASAGHLMFATILGYRQDSIGPKPITWKDFWDVKNFPGNRGLRNNPRGTLEIALLADGVPANMLYPLDVDRAFRNLDKLRGHIVYWDSGAQPIELLANKVVTMTSVYNGRIWDASHNEKLPLGWSMSQGLFELEFWAVPKNSKNKEKAFDFIRFSLQREPQATFVNAIAYAPTNTEAMPLVSEEVKKALPGVNGPGSTIVVDSNWWAKNEANVSARWEAWKLKK